MAPSPGPDTELDCHTSHLNLKHWSLDTEADIVSFPQSNTAICYNQGKVNDLCLRLGYCVCYIYRDSDRSHLARLSREAIARGPDLVPAHTFPSPGNFPEDGASSEWWGGVGVFTPRQEEARD